MSINDVINFYRTILDNDKQFKCLLTAKDLVQKSGLDKNLIKNQSLLAVLSKPSHSNKLKIKRSSKPVLIPLAAPQHKSLQSTWEFDNE